MSRLTRWLAVFLAELERRKVVQVAIAYVATAWLITQVVQLALEAFDAPNWLMQALLVLVVIGLPIVVALSWIFDLTPQGFTKTLDRVHAGDERDTLSAVLAFSAQADAVVTRAVHREFKVACQRFGSKSVDRNGNVLVAQFENAHEALFCALYLMSLSQSMEHFGLGLTIGEAGWHEWNLAGGAVDDAEQLTRFAPNGGLAVSIAFYESILDRPVCPLQDKMDAIPGEAHGNLETVYVANRELLEKPDVRAWQQGVVGEESSVGSWIKLAALVLLVAIGVSIWRWLPEFELPGYAELAPSVAMLPLDDISEDKSNQWFVAGLGEEVLTTIARIEGLRVVSRTTSDSYRSLGKGLKEIGQELGVNHLLEGSVNRAGGLVRINMRLSSSVDGSIRWAQNYNANPEDLFSVTRDIARGVATSLEVALDKGRAISADSAPTVSPEAYTEYLEAMGYLKQPPSTETLEAAQARLSHVVATEPDFHDALAGLCRTNLQWYRLTQDVSYFDLAQQQCGMVLQANRENVGAMRALGQLYIEKGDPQKATEYFRRGLSLDSNDVDLQAGLANAMRSKGDREGAERLLRQAIAIEPGNWGLHSDLGNLYLSWGRSAEAVEAYDRAFALLPDNASVLGNLGSAYYYLGEFRKAALAYERSLEFDATASAYSNIATLWYFEGSFEKALNYYRIAAELSPSDYRVWSNLADAEKQLPDHRAAAASHYSMALEMAEDLLKVNPTNAEVLAISAWCAANLRRMPMALERISQAEQYAPNDPNVSYVAATVYAEIDAKPKMSAAIERSIQHGFPLQILKATPILKQEVAHFRASGSKGDVR